MKQQLRTTGFNLFLVLLVVILGWAMIGVTGTVAQTDTIVSTDGEVSENAGTIDCDGTTANVYSSVDAAVANTGSGGEVKVCPGTYGSDEEIRITSNMTIKAIGTGDVIVQSRSDGGTQEAAILIEETASEEITNLEITGLDVEHRSNGASTDAPTIEMRGALQGIELKNMSVTRGSSLNNTGSAIRPDGGNVTIKQSEISGGPIGFYGSADGDYEITGNTIRGAGDEAIWVAYANTLDISGNTIETTSDGDPGDDEIAIAVYYVDSFLILENNSIEATGAPLLLGNDLGIRNTATGATSSLQTAGDLWNVLGRNTINGQSPGKVAFVAQSDGTLRNESGSASDSVSTVHVVRTGLTNVPGVGGSAAYSSSALQAAQNGDVLHLTDGMTYSEHVTLTSSAVSSSRQDIDVGFSSAGTATLDTLGIDGPYTVDAPSGTLAIGDSLMTGQGSTLSGNPIVLGSGAVLADNGLIGGSIEATRTVDAGQTVDFGNIGLTLSEGGGQNSPGQTTVTRTDGDPVTMGGGSIERYYDVTPDTTSGLNVDLTFEYDDGTTGDNELDESGLSENNGGLTLFKSDDGGSTWAEISSVTSFDPGANTLDAVGLSSFSRFTAAETGSALPVELSGFEGQVSGDAVVLQWTTLSERGNAGFDIQRAVKEDGTVGTFQKIGFAQGHGTTSSQKQYRFEDTNLPYEAETLVYRLRQIDRDGSETLSDPVTVQKRAPDQSALYGSVSNPVRQTALIRYKLAESANVTISVFNTLGQRVARVVDGKQDAGRQTVQFETSGLPSGVYFIRMRTEDMTQTKRMTIVR